jgi:hypothetical protein
MNAILREEYEAPVLSIDAIEVHLSHMQPDLTAVKAALPVLRDKIDQLSEKMDSKIDQSNRDRATGDTGLAEKIDQVAARTDAKIDHVAARIDAKIDQVAARTDAKIDQVAARIDAKIDQANWDRAAGDAALSEKIDQANKDRAAGDTMLAEKIDRLSARMDAKFDRLTEVVHEIRGSQKGLKWFIGSITVILGGVALARTLGWI